LPEKQTLALISAMVVILLLTAVTAGTAPSSPILGAFAPIILPVFLTWYLIMLVANSRLIVDVLAAFMVSRPKEGGRRLSLLATILSYVIVTGLLVLFLRSGVPQNIINALRQTGSFFSITGNRSLLIPPSEAAVLSPTHVLLSYYAILIFGAIIFVSFSLLILSFQKAFKYVRDIATFQTQTWLREEARQVVKDAVANLRMADRYQETIVRCYKQMCRILSDSGFVIGKSETAREFAAGISNKLCLGSDAVNGLTFLFEEARYSKHEINDEKRALALSKLNSLEQALAQSPAIAS